MNVGFHFKALKECTIWIIIMIHIFEVSYVVICAYSKLVQKGFLDRLPHIDLLSA